MNSVWYKFRSAATWRELQIPSTFITIGEMRQLICKELHLQEQETVLLSENGDDNYRPLADEKQFPRGSRFWARRTTFDHINREQRVQEQTQRANDAQTGVQDSTPAQEYSDDDFGPDLFDRAAQLKYEERERLEAIADQHKLELEQKAQQTEQAEEQAWDSSAFSPPVCPCFESCCLFSSITLYTNLPTKMRCTGAQYLKTSSVVALQTERLLLLRTVWK